MSECGQIVEVKDNIATIKLTRKSACASCGACGMGGHQKDMLLSIPNTLGGEVGDYAELDLSSKQLLKASVIMYVGPLIALLAGVVAGYLLGAKLDLNKELFAVILGLLFTGLSYLGIRVLEPRFKKGHNFSPQLVKIIKKDTKGEDLDGKCEGTRAN